MAIAVVFSGQRRRTDRSNLANQRMIGASEEFNGALKWTFVLDTNVADASPGNPSFGLYPEAGTWTGDIIGGDQDGSSFRFLELIVNIFNADDPSFDSMNMNFGASNVLLSDVTGTAFASDQLPSILNVESFSSVSLLISSQDILGNQAGARDQTSLYVVTSITTVPEPTSFLLLISTLVLGQSFGRRRS